MCVCMCMHMCMYLRRAYANMLMYVGTCWYRQTGRYVGNYEGRYIDRYMDACIFTYTCMTLLIWHLYRKPLRGLFNP